MKIYGTAKGAALSTKDFGVAFGGAEPEPAIYPDSCESTTDGTVSGAVINTADEKLGSGCLSFDGTNDYVTCDGWISCPVLTQQPRLDVLLQIGPRLDGLEGVEAYSL